MIKKLLNRLIQTELDLWVLVLSISFLISSVIVYGLAWIFGGL